MRRAAPQAAGRLLSLWWGLPLSLRRQPSGTAATRVSQRAATLSKEPPVTPLRASARPKTSTALGSPGWVKPPALNKLGGGTAPGVWPRARLARHALARPRVASPSSGGTSLPESRPSRALDARRARHRERWSSGCREAVTPLLRAWKLPPNKRLARRDRFDSCLPTNRSCS